MGGRSYSCCRQTAAFVNGMAARCNRNVPLLFPHLGEHMLSLFSIQERMFSEIQGDIQMLSLFFILMMVTVGTILWAMTSMLRRISHEQQKLVQHGRVRTHVASENIYSDVQMDEHAEPAAALPSLFHEVGRTRAASNTIPLRRPVNLYKPHVRSSEPQPGSGRSA